MTLQIEELEDLWISSDAASLGRIPPLCHQLESLAAGRDAGIAIDRDALRRIERLAYKAEQRLVECVAIQTRTGTYATNGAFEQAPRLATTGWEG